MTSAVKLLHEGHHKHQVFESGNMRALAYFCHETMTALVPLVKEVSMDATFGTNNSGMDLFALLAEFDGSGFPLGYFFVETISVECDRPSVPGALAGIIEKFLQVFKDSG